MKPTPENSIQKVFSPQVANSYELVNHIITCGLDVFWRKQAVKISVAHGGTHWADMCTGTGELAIYLSRCAPPETTIHAIDFSAAMLATAMKKPAAKNIEFVVSDVKNLEFPDNTFDLITISFATRNLNLNKETLTQTFAEFLRVLKPGGRFINLETSQPVSPLFRKLVHFYIKLVVKSVGGLISGSSNAYGYLAHSIPRFYMPDELSNIMRQAGFTNVKFKKLMFGVAAIHQGLKS